MISDELKEQVMHGIRDVVPEENWGDIPGFFDRAYLMDYDDDCKVVVVGYWDDPNPVICLDVVTGNFVGVCTQEWVAEHGILL